MLKARDISLLLKWLSRNGFTQPNLKIHLELSNSHKEMLGGLSKCSQGSQDVLKYSSISTHEWVKSWGINTPSHKTSLLKHASRSSTFILAVHLELILVCVMHEIFKFSIQSYMQASHSRHHICINSCLILFALLACFLS